MTTFKVGDWVISEFEIKQVMEMQGDRVTELSDGSFRSGGSDLQCHPLTLRNKNIADNIRHYNQKLHDAPHSIGLNFPDIHRWLSDKCSEAIEAESDDGVKVILDEVASMYNQVKEHLNNPPIIKGIKLFR